MLQAAHMIQNHDFSSFASLLALTSAVLVAPSALSAAVDLTDLVGGLERGCQLTKPLGAFRAELNRRYTFEEGSARLSTKVHVPNSFAAAIGRATATNHHEYTQISVPLRGTYRGLTTQALSFQVGHSNGVNVTVLSFAAPRHEVEKVIGADVARTMLRFEADPEEKEFGFFARIIHHGGGTALVCNRST